MRAARYHRFGDPDVLAVEEAPDPGTPPGAVRIRTLAASVNPIDWQIRSGALQGAVAIDFPVVPGRDAVGVVDEVGAGVVGTAPGDVVFGLGGLQDTTAELAVLTAWATPPPTWSTAQAAGAGLASATALGALGLLGPLEGMTLLVEGASGAVGSAAAVFAIERGARVVGTGSAANLPYLEEIGVVPVEYGAGLAARVAALAGGVDAAVEAAGAGTLETVVAITGDAARVSTVTDPAGAARLGAHLVWAENDSAVLREAAEAGARGRYMPRVGHVLDLADVAEAHRLAERSASGKVVVGVATDQDRLSLGLTDGAR